MGADDAIEGTKGLFFAGDVDEPFGQQSLVARNRQDFSFGPSLFQRLEQLEVLAVVGALGAVDFFGEIEQAFPNCPKLLERSEEQDFGVGGFLALQFDSLKEGGILEEPTIGRGDAGLKTGIFLGRDHGEIFFGQQWEDKAVQVVKVGAPENFHVQNFLTGHQNGGLRLDPGHDFVQQVLGKTVQRIDHLKKTFDSRFLQSVGVRVLKESLAELLQLLQIREVFELGFA